MGNVRVRYRLQRVFHSLSTYLCILLYYIKEKEEKTIIHTYSHQGFYYGESSEHR